MIPGIDPRVDMFGSLIHLQRILYYWAILHGGQLHEGNGYGKLRTTISIAIVNTVLFTEVPDYHLHFQPRSTRHPHLVFSGQQSIHLLELPKFRKSADELTDPLDVWCYFLTHGTELDTTHMPPGLQTPAVQRAMEVLEMMSKSDLERERYQARLKWERDQSAFIDEARAAAAEAGEKGEWIGRIQMCQEWLAAPVTPREELFKLAIRDLESLADALEEQVRARKT